MNMNNDNQQLSTCTQRFFWWFAGADIRLLETCRSEWHRFTAIGIFVVIVGVLATISGTFFLTEALAVPTYLAIFGGLFWGSVIVSVDRVLLTHFEKGKGQLMRSIPRLALAVVISIVISHPLLLKMFEGEIEARLHDVKTSKLQTVRNSSEKQAAVARLNGELTRALDRLNKLQLLKDDAEADMNKERGGVKTDKTTGKIGEGNIFGLKKKIFDDASANLEKERPALDAQISDLRSQLANLENGINTEVGEVNEKETRAAGVLNRQKALSSILREDWSLAFEAMCLFLLLLGVETLPITQKLFSKRRRYDILVQNEVDSAEAEITRMTEQRAEDQERESKAETDILVRVMDRVGSGEAEDLTNAAERDLAKAIHMSIIRKRKNRLFSSKAKSDPSFGTPVTVEVKGQPQLTAQIGIPKELESTLTFESLSQQIDTIAAEVSKDLGYPVKLKSVTNSDGEEIDRVFLSLTQQLTADRKLIIAFCAMKKSDTNA